MKCKHSYNIVLHSYTMRKKLKKKKIQHSNFGNEIIVVSKGVRQSRKESSKTSFRNSAKYRLKNIWTIKTFLMTKGKT